MHVVVKKLTGHVAGNTMTGAFSETWHVFEAGTENRLGSLVLNGSFAGQRR